MPYRQKIIFLAKANQKINELVARPVVAGVDVAPTHLVAFEDHWGLDVVKVFFQPPVLVIPRLDAQVRAVAGVLRGAFVGALTVL